MRTAVNFVLGGVIFTSLLVGGMFLGAVATYSICKDVDAEKKANQHMEYHQKWYTDADFSKETDKT